MKEIRTTNRILAIICIMFVMVLQLFFVMPESSYAVTAGDVLSVRVQYYGEAGSKIREKASFTR